MANTCETPIIGDCSLSRAEEEPHPLGPNELTFGVELELLIAYRRRSEDPDPHPEDPRSIDGIVGTHYPMDDYDFTERIQRRAEGQKRVVDFLRSAGWNANSQYENVRFEDWVVKDDPSINVEGDEDKWYGYLTMEIVSPPFFATPEAVSDVGAVCDLLVSKYRILCNNTTGLHCHVGYGHHGFSPRVLTNFFATVWTFNELLENLHPARRRGDASLNVHSYYPSFRYHSELGCSVGKLLDGKIDGLEQILSCREELDTTPLLNLVLSPGGRNRLSYNARNLALYDRGDPHGKLTLEFRQHEGTLASQRVMAWINVCVGLVNFADKVDDAVLDEFLKNHISDSHDSDYTVIELLKAIGLPAEAEFYKTWFEANPTWLDPPIPEPELSPDIESD